MVSNTASQWFKLVRAICCYRPPPMQKNKKKKTEPESNNFYLNFKTLSEEKKTLCYQITPFLFVILFSMMVTYMVKWQTIFRLIEIFTFTSTLDEKQRS